MMLDSLQKEKIYTDYREKVTSYVRGKVANFQDAEDIVSQVFVKVYSKIDTYDEGIASLSTWIYHITQNSVIDYYRKRRVFSEIPDNMSDDESIDDKLVNDDMLERLADALECLDKRTRNIIILHYYSGKTLKEIAQAMDISYIYIKVLHKKALSLLKEKML